MSDATSQPRPAFATALAVALLVVGFAVACVHPGTIANELSPTLVAVAVLAELLAPRVTARVTISGSFVAAMLAVVFLGPAMAFIAPAAGYLATWIVERYRWRALLINVAASSSPSALMALAFGALHVDRESVGL